MTAHPFLQPARVPLRIRMSPRAGRDRLDGAWWPQSRDLSVELADLVDHFPAGSGRITRAIYSTPDWDDEASRQVAVAGGSVKIGAFPRHDTHAVRLQTSDRTILFLLVVPPGTEEAAGQAALLAAAAQGSAEGAEHLLAVAAAWAAGHDDAVEQWRDDVGS